MLRNIYAGFAVVVGTSMIAVWIMLLATGQVTELVTSPFSIGFHLAAEFVTSLALIVGGAALYRKHILGEKIYVFSSGMLIYTIINSSGYYAQSGDWAFVIMFSIIFVLALIILIGLIGRYTLEKSEE